MGTSFTPVLMLLPAVQSQHIDLRTRTWVRRITLKGGSTVAWCPHNLGRILHLAENIFYDPIRIRFRAVGGCLPVRLCVLQKGAQMISSLQARRKL